MDNLRLIIFAAICFVGLQLYLAWQTEYGRTQQSTEEPRVAFDPPIPVTADTLPPKEQEPTNKSHATLSPTVPSSKPIRIITDLFDLEINPLGGNIERTALRTYPVNANTPNDPFILLDRLGNLNYFIQSGLSGDGDNPDHRAEFAAERDSYTLKEDENFLSVSLYWSSDSGVTVEKIFNFNRASYVVDIRYVVHNASTDPWSGRAYIQTQRKEISNRGFVYSFNGIAISSPDERYKKTDFDSLRDADIDQEIEDGWAALIQHYFVVALLPTDSRPYRYYSRVIDDSHYLVGIVGPSNTIAPGNSGQFESRVYLGPKLQHVLPGVADGLALTVDYGVFWAIAKPLFWALEHLQGVFGNWGWAIVCITLLLKILFFPLQNRAYRSMARMRKLQPRIQAIRDRYGDDPQRLRNAMAELYRSEKFNPLGGCLPTLLQIPVFIALYWVLLESVEMRQAPFVLWLNDLSSPDPYYVLPLLMGITMFFTQKLNPAPPDPMQAKVMQILPVVFTLFYVFMPSGLVLYWTVQSALSLIQQYLITRKAEAEPA